MAASLSLSRSLKLQRRLLLLPNYRFPALYYTSDASLSSPSPPSPQPTRASSSSQSQEKERGLLSKFLLFLPGAITFGLGTWQFLRRQEKIEMLDHRRKRLETEPVTCKELPFLSNTNPSLEYRKLVCEGDFDEKKSIYVGPRSRSISGITENGYYLITPLIPRETGIQTPILVNRGWVPRSWRDKDVKSKENLNKPSESGTDTGTGTAAKAGSWLNFFSQKSPSPKGEENKIAAPVRITGVIRSSESPSIYVPQNDPNTGQWFFIDVPQIARNCGLPESSIYVEAIEEDENSFAGATNRYPVPKDLNSLIKHSVMPQGHLNYMLTWYTLSGAVTFMAVKTIKAKKIRL